MKRFILGVAVAAAVFFVVIAVLTRRTSQPPQYPGVSASGENPRFKFVVLSDLRGRASARSPLFEETVREINLIDPEFTISVGGLIQADVDNVSLVASQWETFDNEIKKFRRPFWYVFGSRDAPSTKAIDLIQQRYQQRYGALYYSFPHKRCHFIVLFTETRDEKGEPVPLEKDVEQIAWLKRDLATHADAVHTFVFYNRPDATDKLLPFFKGRPTTIFAGGEGASRQFSADGVDVHVLGAPGRETGVDLYAGGVHQFMLVTVSGQSVIPAMVRLGGVLPGDFLSDERLAKIREARAEVQQVVLRVSAGGTSTTDEFKMSVPNPLPTSVAVVLEWDVPKDSPWLVSPDAVTVFVPAEGRSAVTFTLKCSCDPFSVASDKMPTLRVYASRLRRDVLYDYETPLRIEKK